MVCSLMHREMSRYSLPMVADAAAAGASIGNCEQQQINIQHHLQHTSSSSSWSSSLSSEFLLRPKK